MNLGLHMTETQKAISKLDHIKRPIKKENEKHNHEVETFANIIKDYQNLLQGNPCKCTNIIFEQFQK